MENLLRKPRKARLPERLIRSVRSERIEMTKSYPHSSVTRVFLALALAVLAASIALPSVLHLEAPISMLSFKWLRSHPNCSGVARIAILLPSLLAVFGIVALFLRARPLTSCSPQDRVMPAYLIPLALFATALGGAWNGCCMDALFSLAEGWFWLPPLLLPLWPVLIACRRLPQSRRRAFILLCVFTYEAALPLALLVWGGSSFSRTVWGTHLGISLLGIILTAICYRGSNTLGANKSMDCTSQ